MNVNSTGNSEPSETIQRENRFSRPLSSKFFSKGLSSLSHLLLPRLISTTFRLVQTKTLMNKFISFRLEQTCYKNIRRRLSSWNLQAKKIAKILSGMKILEKQKARREAKKKIEKKKSNNPGLEEIQQQKALSSVERLLKRIQSKFKREVFQSLQKESLKHEKVDFFLKIKSKRSLQSLFCLWKREIDSQKHKRGLFFKSIEKILKVELNARFRRLVKDVKTIRDKSFKISLMKLEKVLSRTVSGYLRQVVKVFSRNDYAKLTLGALKIELIKKSKIRKAWARLLSRVKKANVKKSFQAAEVLKRIVTKSFNRVILLIFSSKITVNTLKLTLAIEKMMKFQRKLKQKAFNKLGALRITKFQKYSAFLIIKKITNSFKNSKKFAISKIVCHSNELKLLKSLEKLVKFTEKIKKTLKIFSFKSIRSNWKRKVSQGLIWKAKFYQLEGLLQHKKEEISLKAKLQHFYKWKKFMEEIRKIKEKALLKRSTNFFRILKNIQTTRRGKQVLTSFLLIKQIWSQQLKSLTSISKIFKKHLQFLFFERFKRKVQGSLLSPKNRLSVYTPYSKVRQSSPSQSINVKNINKRYGFYSTKRLSLDHSVHKYIDQMIRVVPPLDKPSSMSLPFDRRSEMGHK